MKTRTKNTALLAGTLTTGLAASVNAATVQISLTGNLISTTGGNQLNPDLTGDLIADLSITDPVASAFGAGLKVGGQTISAYYSLILFADAGFAAGGVGNDYALGRYPQNTTYLNPIMLTDSRINNGMATEAWLEVNAFNTSLFDHTVALTRVIFDDASTTRPAFTSIPGALTEAVLIPEPSSLALLALGAGGLLARRKRLAA